MRKEQDIIICNDLHQDLEKAIRKCACDRLFILTDENTYLHCLPLIVRPKDSVVVRVGAGDVHKTLDVLAYVWAELSSKGATRHSLLINLGGGMITDLGGFAAAAFKRGISVINIPTTLLAMVDASVGGKTGINFCGLKNEIGAFYPADSVLIDCNFLRTLSLENILSGYAEMLKHGLISDWEHCLDLLKFDFEQVDYASLQCLVRKSICVKEEIVKQDPCEQGIRKALNFGHTIGHAFESFALERGTPVLHGYAVAWGMVCELYYSYVKKGFPKDILRMVVQFVKENYGTFCFDCKDYERLYEFMLHDKKNVKSNEVNFTLLRGIGDICIDQIAAKEDIFELLDFYTETMR